MGKLVSTKLNFVDNAHQRRRRMASSITYVGVTCGNDSDILLEQLCISQTPRTTIEKVDRVKGKH